jgi:4-hydroxy-4-methyl-2-oxoglutarate aldolase
MNAAHTERTSDIRDAERFSGIRIANLFDAMDSLDMPNTCLDLSIQTIFGRRLAGRALTVHGRRAPFTHDEVRAHESRVSYRTVRDSVFPGCVVVVDGGGHACAGKFGEMTSWGLQQRGAVGIVVDGYIRDAEGLAEIRSFTVCARGTTPIEGRRRWSIESVDVVIGMPGTLTTEVRVAPGDWIVAGPDGVLAIPQEIASRVLTVAEDIETREDEMRRQIAKGMDFAEATRKYGRE